MQRKLAAILAADVVGYSKLMAEDEAGTLSALREHRHNLFDPETARHGGRVVKLMGDGSLVEFPSVVDAVECALAIQRALDEANSAITLRIGINLGDVIIEGDDLYGDGVNIAARLEGLAAPGGICISAKVYDEVKNKIDVAVEDLGHQSVKNIADPIRAYQIMPGRPGDRPEPAQPKENLALPDKPSIAVLPFDNMSNDPEQEYFSDGITEDIITELSSFRSIFVIARNSSFVYKGTAQDIKRVGRELGVRYVLEGSVRKSTGRVRITAQLIEAATGNHLWAQRYDRVLEDVFDLQDEITETIVAAIQPELESAERERARQKPAGSLDAWEFCQRGLWHTYRISEDDTSQAEEHFKKALSIAPDYALALTGMAYVGFQRVLLHYRSNQKASREQLLQQALISAHQAVQIDDRDAFAQFVLGRLLALKGDFDESIERLRIAVKINPNYAIAHHGLGYSLAFSGKSDEAIAEFDAALRLSPKDTYRFAFKTMRAFALLSTKDFEAAVDWGRQGIRDQPNLFWAYAHVASALGHLGPASEAQLAFADLLRVSPEFSIAMIDETVQWKHAADREFYIDGLRKAGLPE